MIVFAINALSLALQPLAGSYRVLAYKLRSFGNVGEGALTWLGVGILYPYAFIRWGSLATLLGFLASWLALALMTLLQMWVRWISEAPRLAKGVAHCWLGRAEPVLAVILSVAADHGCGTGRFFLIGYLCSSLQIGLARLRSRLEAWTPEDTERLAARLRVGAGFLAPLKVLLPRRVPVAEGATVKQPTFMSRVASHMVASLIISFITGFFNIWSVLGVIWKVCLLAMALTLGALGWEVKAPEDVKAEAQATYDKARDTIRDKRDQLEERFEAGKERLKERFEDGKERLSEEVESRKRRAVWNFFTH